MIDIAVVKERYIKSLKMSTKPIFDKPNIGDIIDENKSVIWNRNEVNRLINNWIDKNNELVEAKNRLITNCENDIIKYISESCNMSENKAKHIFDFAYAERHSCIEDMFIYIEQLIDLFIDVREA